MKGIIVTSEVLLAWVRSEADFGVEAALDVETTVEAIDDEAGDVQMDVVNVVFVCWGSDEGSFTTMVIARLEVTSETSVAEGKADDVPCEEPVAEYVF